MDLYGGAARNFPATQHIQYAGKFKDKWWDASILQFITNQDYKGMFHKKGTEIRVPIRPVVQIRDTTPGGGIIYQKPKGREEIMTIGRESYWALEFLPEDTEFSAIDIKNPLIGDAANQMAEWIEMKFGADIINKVHPDNSGNTAGRRSHGYMLGAVGSTGSSTSTRPNAVKLFKTQAQCDADSGTTYKEVGPDYVYHCFSCLKEQKGAKGREFFMVIPTIMADRIQCSELKMAGWMNEANSSLRKDVTAIGSFNGNNNNIYVDDTMLPIFSESYGTGTVNVYPVLFGAKIATTFAQEVVWRDSNLKDIASWDDYHRCKTVYDWMVRYRQFIGVGYVYMAA